mmetsp:Transcript_35741/g.90336  ORF Transcript_35741/g.90336 Transcript_35741/m.90336 type:complete len:278 (-) Transcript_35741:411-1244(-)
MRPSWSLGGAVVSRRAAARLRFTPLPAAIPPVAPRAPVALWLAAFKVEAGCDGDAPPSDPSISRYSLMAGSHRFCPCLLRASGKSFHRCDSGLHSSLFSALSDSGSVSSQSPCSSHIWRLNVRFSPPPAAPPPTRSLHANTCPSCPALAMVERGRPRLGAHATSRTQSVWPGSASSSAHMPPSPQLHTLIVLSQPQLTRRLTGAGGALEETRDPGATAGAQDTAVAPTAWLPGSFVLSHWPVLDVYSMMEMVPSEEAAARMSPSSWGAHAMLLMDAV